MTCPGCGKELDPGARFCSGCGRAQYMPPMVPRSRYIRPREGRMVAGVCAGIALYHGWDIAIVRLVTALLILFCGLPIVLYFIAWIVMPNGDYALPPTTGAAVS